MSADSGIQFHEMGLDDRLLQVGGAKEGHLGEEVCGHSVAIP